MSKREEVVEKILEAKQASGLGWKELAAKISSGSPIVTTAALLGQMTLTVEEAETAAELFSLTKNEAALLTQSPYRGAGPAAAAPGPPSDPLLYRFHELLQVYGSTWKALIEEEFGDGIMSAVDFNMSLEREPDPKGDRVKITLSGKFLPYKRY